MRAPLLVFIAVTLLFAGIESQTADDLVAETQALLKQRRVNEAREIIVRAVQLDDNNANAHYLLGVIDEYLGDKAAAMAQYRRVFDLAPQFVDVWKQAGYLLLNSGQVYEAIEVMKRATKLIRTSPVLFDLLGRSYSQLHENDKAERAFRKALDIDSSYHIAWNNLGTLYMSSSNFPPAIEAFERTNAIKFEPSTFANLMICLNRVCNWKNRPAQLQKMREIVSDDIKQFKNTFSPFHSLEFELPPKLLLEFAKVPGGKARAAAEQFTRKWDASNAPSVLSPLKREGPKRLRVGYISGIGFASDATTTRFLVNSFALHNRTRVDIICFGLKEALQDEPRMTTLSHCSEYVELHRLTNPEAVAAIAAKKVHVLVDLTGYTVTFRKEVLAARPAPVLLQYHGYPGTLGAGDWCQYAVTDPITITPQTAVYYTEKQVMLPYTYLINSFNHTRREVYKPSPVTRDFVPGLPETGTVFCSFNQYYKVDPALFTSWMHILKRVPRSVLWMMNFTPTGIETLKREAKKRGIRPSRLVFSDFFSKDVEFHAKGMCDLFLDSRIFNGHTTTTDALWSGVPVLTYPGQHWAQRVALALQEAAGISLSASSLQQYEELAVQSVAPPRLAALKESLRSGRSTAPLWNTALNTRYLETGFLLSYDLYAAGTQPQHIIVNRHF